MTATADPVFWDRLAEKYSRQPIANPAAWEAKQRVHIGLLHPGDRVLDVGCGTGSLCLLLAPHVAHAQGLDLSGEMVRIAREKAERAGVGNASFARGTLDDLPSLGPGDGFATPPEHGYDVVSAYSFLHLVGDVDAALARLYALTRPGGRLVTSTVVLGDSWAPYGLLLPVLRWVGYAPPVTILRRAEVLARIAAAGFVDVEAVDVGADGTVLYALARRPA